MADIHPLASFKPRGAVKISIDHKIMESGLKRQWNGNIRPGSLAGGFYIIDQQVPGKCAVKRSVRRRH